jgi:hypothetical protein
MTGTPRSAAFWDGVADAMAPLRRCRGRPFPSRRRDVLGVLLPVPIAANVIDRNLIGFAWDGVHCALPDDLLRHHDPLVPKLTRARLVSARVRASRSCGTLGRGTPRSRP